MRQKFSALCAILALFAFLFTAGSNAVARTIEVPKTDTPTTISYQGYVKVSGTPVNGIAYFKFALLDSGGATHWSNDGSSTSGNQPVAAVPLSVVDGLFTVMLGDTSLGGMTQPLSAEVFAGADLALRVWFSVDNLSFTQLTPDRVLASAPFAFQAQQAANAALLDGLDSVAFALASHDHNSAYAALGHNHNDLYAAITHTHADLAPLNHNHDTAYAALGHNHNTLYAALVHNHDSAYAALSHDHNTAYVNDNAGEVDNNDINAGVLSPDRINGTAWTTLNDGTSSGMDADKLDGQEGSYYQRRVSGACAAGSTIRVIAADGSVTCEPHITRPGYTDLTAPSSAWNFGTNPSITIGLDGLPVISFRDWVQQSLKFIHCNDLNCVSTTTRTLRQGNDTGFATQITIGSDGNPVIIFADSGFSTGNLYVLHCQDTLCNDFNTQTLGPEGVQRYGQSIAIGLDGYPVISYYDVGNQNLLVAHCEDVSCNSISTQTVDTAVGTNWSYTSITIGMDGIPVISYYDPATESLNFAYCGNANCSSDVVTRTISTAGDYEGIYNQITIGFDGLPVIAYSENSSLKFLHCGNITCSTVTEFQTLFTSPPTWPSLTIGNDGFPMITFYDWNAHDLKLIHCKDLVCATFTQFSLTEPQNDGTSSITIGADGLPIIAYNQESPGNMLRVLHCANLTCVPYWRRR
ncbi:MAG TPA: hypothetical protein VFF78_02340 [Anaerolineaceae bacterium]|nr:hypothetical protein [Anaerolineaceae bacterium]